MLHGNYNLFGQACCGAAALLRKDAGEASKNYFPCFSGLLVKFSHFMLRSCRQDDSILILIKHLKVIAGM
jgi:hypothetical protein